MVLENGQHRQPGRLRNTMTMDLQVKDLKMRLCTEIKVRGYHLDFYGHVNNARYLEFMEEARWAMLDAHLDLEELTRLGIIFVAVNININYRKTAALGEILEFYVGLKKIGSKSATLLQEARLKNTDTIVADAEVTFVLADAKTGKSVDITDELKTLLNQLQ